MKEVSLCPTGIAVFNEAVVPCVLEKYINIYKKKERQVSWSHPESNKLNIDDSRVSLSKKDGDLGFLEVFWKEIFPVYTREFEALLNIDCHIPFLKVQKTSPSEGYHLWHYETGSLLNVNRVFNVMLYLNDVEEGGETEFLIQKRRIKPSAGTVVLFPSGYTHVHRGNPPISGDKYILNGWVYSS